MGDLLGLSNLDAADLLALVLAAPYLFIVTGRLVPYRQYKHLLDLLATSEAGRERALLALSRVGDAIDAGTEVVNAALSGPDDNDHGARSGDRGS